MIELSNDVFVRYIKGRVSDRQSKNFMGICTGQTGGGKSYHLMPLAEKLDKNFSVDRIAFTASELMKIINSGKLKRGSVIIADEFGTAHFSRNFQQVGNIMINYLLQTFRKFGFIFLAATPSISYIDKASRKLFHCHFMMDHIDFKENMSYSKPYLLQQSQRDDKVYMKFLRVLDKDRGNYVALEQLGFPMPSKELIEAYEDKKERFLLSLNKKIENAIHKQDLKDMGQKELTDRQKEIYDLHQGGLNPLEISKKLNVSFQNVYGCLNAIKKKGYDVNVNNND